MARSTAKKKPGPGGRAEAVNVMDALANRLAQLGKRKWKVTACRLLLRAHSAVL
jgi:hypothetical protein